MYVLLYSAYTMSFSAWASLSLDYSSARDQQTPCRLTLTLTVSVKTSRLMLLNFSRSSQQNLLVVDIASHWSSVGPCLPESLLLLCTRAGSSCGGGTLHSCGQRLHGWLALRERAREGFISLVRDACFKFQSRPVYSSRRTSASTHINQLNARETWQQRDRGWRASGCTQRRTWRPFE